MAFLLPISLIQRHRLFCFSSIIWTIYASLGETFLAFTHPQSGLFQLVLDFDYLYVHAILIHHQDMLQVLPCPFVRQLYLRLTFHCFILFLGKAYRHYISTSRDFTHLGPWPPHRSIQKNQIHTSIIYIGNPNFIYIMQTSSTSTAHA